MKAKIVNHELIFDVPKENVFHALLEKTGQLGLYDEADFRLKYGSFSQPLPFEHQTIAIEDLEDHEAVAFGCLKEWEEAKAEKTEEVKPVELPKTKNPKPKEIKPKVETPKVETPKVD